MSIRRELTAMLSILGVATALFATPALAADSSTPNTSGIMQALLRQTGVYDKSGSGSTPDFFADPAWPAPLPHSWLLGQIGGLYVDSHDHVWVYNRPRTLNNDEAGLEPALPGATDARGAYPPSHRATANDCRRAACSWRVSAGRRPSRARSSSDAVSCHRASTSAVGSVTGRCRP